MTFTSKVKLGFSWVTDSLELFKRHPAKWMGLSFLYLFFFTILPDGLFVLIDYLNKANAPIFALFSLFLLALGLSFGWPILTSLVIGICRETHAERATPMKELFHRIRPHVKQLVLLGVIVFVYKIITLPIAEIGMRAINAHHVGVEVMKLDWQLVKLVLLQIPFLLALLLPLLLATWYSPLLISYHQYSVFKSIGHSVWAALHNLTALIAAYVALAVVLAVPMFLLGLVVGGVAYLSVDWAEFLTGLFLIFGFIVATALLFSIQYFSFLSMYYKKGEDFVS